MKTEPNDQATPSTEFGDSLSGIVAIQNHSGLTKREYFAAMAMQGLSANHQLNSNDFENIADMSVNQADALIEALNKQPE